MKIVAKIVVGEFGNRRGGCSNRWGGRLKIVVEVLVEGHTCLALRLERFGLKYLALRPEFSLEVSGLAARAFQPHGLILSWSVQFMHIVPLAVR